MNITAWQLQELLTRARHEMQGGVEGSCMVDLAGRYSNSTLVHTPLGQLLQRLQDAQLPGCDAWGALCWLCMAKVRSSATKEFGERVRARRHKLDKSQEQLARDCGLHWTFVGQVERGQRNLSLHNVLKLAHGLGVDPADLVRGIRLPRNV